MSHARRAKCQKSEFQNVAEATVAIAMAAAQSTRMFAFLAKAATIVTILNPFRRSRAETRHTRDTAKTREALAKRRGARAIPGRMRWKEILAGPFLIAVNNFGATATLETDMLKRFAFVIAIVAHQLSVAGQLSMPLRALRQLPEAEQLKVLHDGLERRAEILSNVYYKSTVENYTRPYVSRSLGEQKTIFAHDEQEYWTIGDSYRFQDSTYIRDEKKPLSMGNSNFDAAKGIARMLGKHSQHPYPEGRISNIHDNATKFNEYAKRCLPGYLHGDRPTLMQYLMDNFDKATLVNDASVPCTVPGTIAIRIVDAESPNDVDTRTYWIAPERDFVIMRWERRDDYDKAKKLFIYSDDWVVDGAEIDGLWMPTFVQGATWTYKVPPQRAGTTDVKIQELRIGKVKEADLQVVFPDGTEVIDDFTQKAYVVGKSDRPIPLVNLQGIAKHQPKRAWPWGILLNVAVVVGLVGLLIARRRRRARLAAT
jgi:hypothetical protein